MVDLAGPYMDYMVGVEAIDILAEVHYIRADMAQVDHYYMAEERLQGMASEHH